MAKPEWKHDPTNKSRKPHIYRNEDGFMEPICGLTTGVWMVHLTPYEGGHPENACKRCLKMWEKKNK